MFILNKANFRTNDPYLVVTHYISEAEKQVQKALPEHKIRSRTVTTSGIELMVEVRMKAQDIPDVIRNGNNFRSKI
ncbi:MAG: hypothetical protein P8X84_02525 [Candidatus Bathyarchaeota archaeon]|jgi:hypothetical protein